MITEWFAGQNLALAMGIFVNSWPVGIACALLVLPMIAGQFGLEAAQAAIVLLIAIGLVALMAFFRPVARSATVPITAPSRLCGPALGCVLVAAGIWAFYNAALAMIFGFGPVMLVERGWTASAASSATSVVLWLVAVSVPLGGLIANWLGRRNLVLITGLTAFAVLMLLVPQSGHMVPMFMALGLVSGLAAGPIMSLPGDVLSSGNRTHGMGMFFTVYYIMIFIAPALAGLLAEAAGTAATAFVLGSGMLVACLPLLWIFQLWARGAARTGIAV